MALDIEPKHTTNEAVLWERERPYHQALIQFQERVKDLKAIHGSWKEIPGRERTALANYLRRSGLNYNPGTGWELPNSNALSSIS